MRPPIPTSSFVSLQEANKNADVQQCKLLLIEKLRLRPGLSILDVGCGIGSDVLDIAPLVGASGAVTGVDISAAMIAEAERRAVLQPSNVVFKAADAMALRFDDASFDGCRAERLLMHVPDPARALSEMVRVTRRGGRIAIFDFDWDTFVIDSSQRELTRQVVLSFSDSMRSGWIGRQMRRLFLDAGLMDVEVTTRSIFVGFEFLRLLIGGHLVQLQTSGRFDPADVRRWWGELHQAGDRGEVSGLLHRLRGCEHEGIRRRLRWLRTSTDD